MGRRQGDPLDGQARGALRFSLGPDNTPAEVESLLEVLPGLVARARARTQVVAEIPDRRFDVVLAMAVLCRHPMTAHPTEWYPFSDFRDQVRRLVDAVEPGGLACFDNVSYRPTDADDRIEPVWSGGDAARIVPVHDPDGTSAEPVGPIFRRVR